MKDKQTQNKKQKRGTRDRPYEEVRLTHIEERIVKAVGLEAGN